MRHLYTRPGASIWECVCDCGATALVTGGNLTRGITRSCGCLRKEKAPLNAIRKHGEAKSKGLAPSREYNIWGGIVQRCCNPRNAAFAHYGGRGISMCDEWRRDFTAFVRDVGRSPSPAHSIDRYPNPDGNYEPGNVRWATPMQQRHNRSAIAS